MVGKQGKDGPPSFKERGVGNNLVRGVKKIWIGSVFLFSQFNQLIYCIKVYRNAENAGGKYAKYQFISSRTRSLGYER